MLSTLQVAGAGRGEEEEHEAVQHRASPWLSIGINGSPRGTWPMKYAAAISPDTMKATGRVNRPISSSAPPTSLEHAGQADQRHQLQVVEHRHMRRVQQLCRAVQQNM